MKPPPVPIGKGRYLEEYDCGCTNVRAKKAELLGYCPRHGADWRRRYTLPNATPIGFDFDTEDGTP